MLLLGTNGTHTHVCDHETYANLVQASLPPPLKINIVGNQLSSAVALCESLSCINGKNLFVIPYTLSN